ncbi:hypothetical protein [Microcystis sp. M061S2]|uniref:hypothetical protein n=1 Tax=Microcystis sp. M061S2 TaxID=2771171 RepID=UPI002589D555|nr:hypothetical protein [Microcystis sp. M061S2]MCA2654520.1 hypothetical protein [Microcystis sp. M061S2]
MDFDAFDKQLIELIDQILKERASLGVNEYTERLRDVEQSLAHAAYHLKRASEAKK